MIESFFTITNSATSTFKEKGSKFIAFAHPVIDSEQIKSKLAEIKKEYYDASHHCYAWILGPDKNQLKAFDDGEPNHSAGDPILNQIRSKNLTNILVIVVRYFGGTKLGVGGLTQAYKTAAAEVLNLVTIKEVLIKALFRIEFSYHDTSVIRNILHECSAEVSSEKFNETCELKVNVRPSNASELIKRVGILLAQGHSIKLSKE